MSCIPRLSASSTLLNEQLGCYECSQRRIHCDRGEPNCAKCAAKGFNCSGLGVRYRFSNDGPRTRCAIFSSVPVSRDNVAYNVSSRESVRKIPSRTAALFIHTDQDLREGNVSSAFSTDPSSGTAYLAPCSDMAENDTGIHDEILSIVIPETSYATCLDNFNVATAGPNDTLLPWKRHLLSYCMFCFLSIF